MQESVIRYPLQGPPRGGLCEVLPGVHWIRVPLPFRLDHINVWALEDGEGWTLVDTGARTDEAVAAWERLLSEPPLNKPITRVIVTHMHPDHIGLAGWLTRKFGVKLWITSLEYLSCRALVADMQREAPADAVQFYTRAGWSAGAIESYRARFGNFGKMVYPLPDSYSRLTDGQRIRIGGHDWEVVIGNGHSPEHACLHCPELKLLISGDQVLPKISSNVSVHAIEPGANPMADWYESLGKLQARVASDVLVLPAHGDVFTGLHARIQTLSQGQDDALARLREVLVEPRRVVDTFEALFRRPIGESDASQLQLATGEAHACLNYLLQRGEIRRELKSEVNWYVGGAISGLADRSSA